MDSTHLLLLIDGLDEIVKLDDREKVKTKIFNYSENNPTVGIVITSRMTQDIAKVGNFHSYERWDILPFNFMQVRSFIEKWFSGHTESSIKLLSVLQDHDMLNKLPNTPLVLTLLAILFDSDDYREIPANLSELYKMFIDLLLGRWNLDRRVETLYNANIREHIAQEVALYLHNAQELSLPSEKFDEIVEQAQSQLGMEFDKSSLKSDFIEQTALIVINDKDELEFRHLSFQEFLVAQNIFTSGSSDRIDFLINNFENPWWSRVLYFFCGLRQKNPAILTRVMDRIEKLDSREQLVSILEFGYLVQSSYLTDINIRINVVEQALRTFFKYIDAIVEVEIEEKKVPEGIIFSMLTLWLTQHYSAGILINHYRKLYEKLSGSDVDEETGFVLLTLAMFVANNEVYDLLANTHGFIKSSPKQMMALNIIGDFFDKDFTSKDKKKADVKQLRSTLKQIKKWFKEHPDITKALMKTPVPELQDGT